MKAGTLLQIGIYVVGLWSLFSGLSSAVYYLHAVLSGPTTDFAGREIFGSMVYGHAVVPLFFSLMCFGFGATITRRLLGKAAEESATSIQPIIAVKMLIRLLSLYLLGTYAGPMAATVYELLAVRSGNPSVSDVQVTSDLIANGVGIAFALWLGIRTDHIVTVLLRDE